MKMKYFCPRCRASCSVELYRCPACGDWNRYVPDVRLSSRRSDSLQVVTARELSARRVTKAALWSVGEVPLKPSLMVTAHGRPGSGKTTWLLRVSSDLLRMGHTVLIVSAEEGLGDTVSERLRRMEVRDEALLLVGNVPYVDVEDVAKDREVTAVMLDSWNDSSWTAPDLDKARSLFMLFTVLQATKSGEAAGSNAILHISDVVINVRDQVAHIEKSRWEGATSTPIFEDIELEAV